MAGGNPPKPPNSGHSNHRKSGWDPSPSSGAAAASSSSSKAKPSPRPTTTTTPQNNSHRSPITKLHQKPGNPSPRPENPRPVLSYPDPPPPPPYGFHMLDRRTMVLADGSVRSYFALPQEYDNFKPMIRPGFRPEFPQFGLDRPPFLGQDARARDVEYWNSMAQKRKHVDDERGGREDGFERQRQQLLQYGNATGPGSSAGYNEEIRASKNMRIHEGSVSKFKLNEVDQNSLKKAFFHFVKLVFENENHRKNYLADGKQGPLRCLVCSSRSSKDFPDAHSLVMHTYHSDSNDAIVDHLAFHKALCILMGWNYLMPPDNSKAYQNMSSDDADANQNDLIMWPPSVLIHNTMTGKGREGRMEGIGNKALDGILRDLGFPSGKSMSLYSKEGHLGIHTVKFSGDVTGLKECLRLAEYLERENRGRKAWAHVQSSSKGKDDEHNPNLMKPDPKTGEKKRVLYGHLATVADLDKLTLEIKKKVSIVSKREYMQSK